jgi:hypothetical protein
MPVRFQVDPDFYDHPKTAGMSDAAFSLWVRAGSYSAAKLTDGFIAETVLVHTLRSDTQVADELVERGLWRRRRGGYAFHEWERRNLTRRRVEAHHKADAKRKQQARQNGNPQVDAATVRPDTSRTPSGLPQESDPCCVGVGVVSSSGSVEERTLVDDGYSFSAPARAREKRGTRIPDDFAVTPDMVAWARENTPHVDGRYETAQFCDYWQSKAGRDATKLNWILTWRTWMRKAEKQAPTSRNGTRSRIDANIAAFEAMKDPHPWLPKAITGGQP